MPREETVAVGGIEGFTVAVAVPGKPGQYRSALDRQRFGSFLVVLWIFSPVTEPTVAVPPVVEP
jgi:hypothetical protein